MVSEKQKNDVSERQRVERVGFRHRVFRSILIVFFHLVLFFVTYLSAYLVRFDFEPGEKFWMEFAKSVPFILFVKAIVFHFQHHYRNDMFFASVTSLRRICESSLYSFIIFFLLRTIFHFPLVSSSSGVLILDLLISIFLLGGVRFVARFVKEEMQNGQSEGDCRPAFIIGSTTEVARVANIINNRKTTGFHVIGFVTTEDYKLQTEVDYIPVVGTIRDFIPRAIAEGVKDLLVIAGFLPGPEFRKIFDACHANGISLHIIPASEISTSQTIPIRNIDINDLLKRDPIHLDTALIEENIRGKKILVTGAGGSIGSEICRQLLLFQPKELLILGRGENRIFFLQRELLPIAGETTIVPIIANVTDKLRIEEVFQTTRPDFVFHAAAHKHVPLMEANVSEAIYNNVFGTKVVADAADRWKCKRFVLISTDKAVNPTSVMGTTKHMAERYVNSLSEDSETKFIVTRFGNVLGSTGSVVPIFKEQIENGGPITITDYRMTRYFMTIPEASQLVLEASVMGVGGEIYVLDMGQPVHILELAKDMIRLAGLPDDSIEIREIGLRPGEKLYEELYFESEQKINTPHPKLYAARHREFKKEVVNAQIDELLSLLDQGKTSDLRRKLKEFIPEYRPNKL